jgi:phage I-like protein
LAWSTPAAGPNEPAAPVRVLGEELALTMLKSGRHASAVAIELRMEVAAVEKLAESLRPARSGPVTLRAFVVGIEALQPVKLDAGTGDTGAPVWIQLARSGSFAGHPSGKAFKLDATTFGQIVTNFHGNRDRRLPIDFEHACEQDPTEGSIAATGVPAQGWIIDMEVRGSDLWAKVEWGTLARQYIRDGQYRFISPAIHFQMKDRVTGQQIGAYISSAGLTNQPFLDGMQPLAATSRPVGLTARTRALMTAEGLSLKEAESRVMAEMRDEAASP